MNTKDKENIKLEVLGLMVLAKDHTEQLRNIELSIAELLKYPIDEDGYSGLVSDEIYGGDCDATKLLKYAPIFKKK